MLIHEAFCWKKATLKQLSLNEQFTRKRDFQELRWVLADERRNKNIAIDRVFVENCIKWLVPNWTILVSKFFRKNLSVRPFFSYTRFSLIILVWKPRCAFKMKNVLRGTKIIHITSEMIFLINRSVHKNGIETSVSAKAFNVTATSSLSKTTKIFKEISLTH